MVLILIGLLGKVNYNASLYKKQDNAIEFIFPIWDWGHPWFYAYMDSDGTGFTAPDDLSYRFYEEKFKKLSEKKDAICKEKGANSEECEVADLELEEMQNKLEDAQMELNDIIDEKGDEVRLSRTYDKKEFNF
jgi:hypothetical protein